MTLLGRLDRIVYAIGFDRIIFMTARPRSFRWTPLIILAALVTGYVVMVRAYGAMVTEHEVARDYLLGWALFYGAYLAAAFLRVFGPRFTGTVHRNLDEREAAIKARAHAISGVVVTGFAMFACFYMAVADGFGLWSPNNVSDWVNLAFGIQATGMLLPTWVASWLQPRPVTDDED